MADVTLTLTLNGKTHRLDAAPHVVLADLLRERFALTGCKVGCDEGVCGACTVLVNGRPTAACTTFAFAVDGCAVTTIEGLGHPDVLHRVQAAFLATGAFQCGFCTSGMIMSIVALLAEEPDPDDATIRDWLGANLCRCTGYGQIVSAIRQAVLAQSAVHAS
jgi:aerobic-type carbon monoxide dehydrogenase small subunit (CoxS/CutS family)